eukprot:TRINITY_DN10860_c0_g1_i1.p1 TRINITY_DN10860_c0_g1~~TRINITY_DN10860_c0_g1_i1.p1  ORF type:complete len:135 (-),score=17.67 TRINITY_DN10860_c0_g1_i1:216-620(-)
MATRRPVQDYVRYLQRERLQDGDAPRPFRNEAIDVLKSTVDEVMDFVIEEAALHTTDKLVNHATHDAKDLVDADVMLKAIWHTFGFTATSPIGLLDNLPPQDESVITAPIKLPKDVVGVEIQPHHALIESPPPS